MLPGCAQLARASPARCDGDVLMRYGCRHDHG